MSPLFWLLITALFAVPIYLVWEDRARRLPPKKEDLGALNLVGCIGRVVKANGGLRVRIQGPEGNEHVLAARFEDVDGVPEVGQEFLVIVGPKEGTPLVAVPSDLPRLEDQCP